MSFYDAASHNRTTFECGEPSLNDWLARLALLLDAIARTRATIEEAAGIGLVVDALHERAAELYLNFGLAAFKDDPLRLFLRVDWP